MCLFELFCVFFLLELHPGSVSDLGLAMPVTQSLSLSGFPAFNSRHSLGKEKISWVIHYSPDCWCISDSCLCHFSTSFQSIIQTAFIASVSTLSFAQHYFMDLELLVVEGRGGSKQPPCMCWTFEKVCLLPKIAGHSRGSSYLGTKRLSVFPNVGTLNFCSAALLYTFTSTHCRLNTNRTFVKSFFCSKMIPPALKRLLRGICICSGYRQNELDYMCKIYCRPMNWTHKSVWERYLI